MDRDYAAEWVAYREAELAKARPLIERLGYALEEVQPHTEGERYLMQAVTTASGRKLILIGRAPDGSRAIIKMSSDKAGIREIEHERASRAMLEDIGFAYATFLAPRELASVRKGGLLVVANAYIEQEQSFLTRPLEEQFKLALDAFKAQESAHATTASHYRRIRDAFETRDARTYERTLREFADAIRTARPEDERLALLLARAETLVRTERDTLDQYGGFLTHTDFVPHNFRVVGDALYLLDHSSLRFGNKYEGWARFINFMTLYNPPLASALMAYVAANRAPEESRSLLLMRVYRLTELVLYYTRAVSRSTGDLKRLNEARIGFWTEALAAALDERTVSEDVRARYITLRDSLRTEDEKRRQQGLH